MVAPQLSAGDILADDARELLQRSGYSAARKIFKHAVPGDTVATSRMTGEPVDLTDLSRWYVVKIADSTDVANLVRRLSKLPSVEAASPGHELKLEAIFPNDPRFTMGLQWGLYNYDSPGKDIHAPQAWERNTGRTDVVVGVIDSGVDYNHPDLDPAIHYSQSDLQTSRDHDDSVPS